MKKRWIIMLALALLLLAACGGKQEPAQTESPAKPKTVAPLSPDLSLEDLEDGMSFDQWIYAFCQRENVRTRNEFKFSIVERNFANFVDWLADEGRIEVRREFCAKHYFHREK